MEADVGRGGDRCPSCSAALVAGSFYCHICGDQVCDGGGLSRPLRKAVIVCRWLLAAGWLVCVIAWVLVVAVDVQSVVVTGPLVFSIGFALIGFCLFGRYRLAVWPGLGHCAICLLFTALVNVFSWSPREAEMPLGIMGAGYVLASLPLTLLAYRRPPSTHQPWECRKCGYLLFGLSSPRCPECGTPFDPRVLDHFEAGNIPTRQRVD